MHRLRLRLRALLDRDHDRTLRDELQLHIDLQADEYVMQGMPVADAQARAQREFGNVTRIQEASHEVFAIGPLEGLLKDLGYALREMKRSPAFTAVAVVSLGIGIGIATATFSVIDALMLRGLPVPRPERLVAVSSATSASWSRWNYATYRQWADAADAPFVTAAVHDFSDMQHPTVTGVDNARVSLVSGNYFDVLGVPAAAGRTLFSLDDRPGGPPVAVISHAFMERHFGSAGAIVGRGLEVNGTPYQVVGVVRRGFAGDWVGQPTDIWLPLSLHPVVTRAPANLLSDSSSARWLRVIARLHDDVSAEQAAASANVLRHRMTVVRSAGAEQSARERSEQVVLLSAAQGYAPLRERYSQPLMIVSAIVLLVLVVASANFSNLLYGRSHSRQQEFAIRLVLGAGVWRIARQSLTECVLLAVLAGGLGLLVSSWATGAALAWFAATIQPVALEAGLDLRVMAFAGAAVALVVLFGLIPCLAAARLSAVQQLSQAAARERRSNVIRRGFLVAQLALCAVLLIGAALMVRTVQNLRTQSLGFDRNILLLTVAPGRAGYSGESASMLLERIREQLVALTDITHVSLTAAPLLDVRGYWLDSSERLGVDGRPPVAGVRWTFADVGPGFFETMGMPLLRGRGLDEGDFNPAADVVVINQALAHLLFGSEDPLGRRVTTAPAAPALSVVGVVNDARQTSPRDRGLAVMYRPLQQPPPQVVMAIRANGPVVNAIDVVHHQLNALDPNLPIVSMQTVEEVLNAAIAQERLLQTFSNWLGLLVIVVVCVGLHALIANDVAERTHEIGVRLALGATRAQIAGRVLRDGAMLVLVALAFGVPLGVAAAQPLSSKLYGLRTDDPQAIAAVMLLLMTVAVIAALRPAQSASRIDPISLLR